MAFLRAVTKGKSRTKQRKLWAAVLLVVKLEKVRNNEIINQLAGANIKIAIKMVSIYPLKSIT